MKRVIEPSELIINEDGTIFHLHLRPEMLADTVILVGDPKRVDLFEEIFDEVEFNVQSREFHTLTGKYNGKRMSVVSHGIGTDNIDIVLTELDALKNIDFATRTVNDSFTQMTLVRLGTSGGLQDFCPVGSYVCATRSIGFDGLLNYYNVPEGVFDLEFERAFCQHTRWSSRLAAPYVVSADESLVKQLAYDMVQGITISAPGFYGPQGRYVRIPLADPELNSKIQSFEYKGLKVTNFEMESSALAGLAALLGHKAVTICAIIAGRVAKNANTNYKCSMQNLISTVLQRL